MIHPFVLAFFERLFMNDPVSKQIRKISTDSSLLLLIFLAVTQAGRIGLFYLTRGSDYDSLLRNDSFFTMLCYLLIYPLLMPLLFLIYNKRAGKKNGIRLKNTFCKPQRSFGWCFKWLVIDIGLAGIVNVAGTYIRSFIISTFHLVDYSAVTDQSGLWKNTLYLIVMFVAMAIFAPFFEECLFRGIIFRNNEKVGQLFAIIVTGIAFGLWHTNSYQVFYASVSGFCLCLVFLKTRSIIPVMLIHFINNTLSYLQQVLSGVISPALNSSDPEYMVHYIFTKQPVAGSAFLLIRLFLIGCMIASVVLVIIGIVKYCKNRSLKSGEFNISKGKKVLYYFSSPVTIITLLAFIYFTFIRYQSF